MEDILGEEPMGDAGRGVHNLENNEDSRCGSDPISKYAFSWVASSYFSRCFAILVLFNDNLKSSTKGFNFSVVFVLR